MNKTPLVSIISPCYNGEKYIENFIESVISQDYPNIEFILVDDGSTDNTAAIIESYISTIQEKGILFKYIFQENSGQAAAINQGLSIFNGDYLMWTDSDDILLENNVSEKVAFLERNPEYGFVLAEGFYVDESNLDKAVGRLRRVKPLGKDTIFKDLILEKNVVFGPGVVMARRNSILQAIPNRQIYESREGQNWQLMLPLAYHFKCGYLEKALFKCVKHKDSHSRKERTPQEELRRVEGMIDLIKNTIQGMRIREESEIFHLLEMKRAHRIVRLGLILSKTENELICSQFRLLRQEKETEIKDYIGYIAYRIRNMV